MVRVSQIRHRKWMTEGESDMIRVSQIRHGKMLAEGELTVFIRLIVQMKHSEREQILSLVVLFISHYLPIFWSKGPSSGH